MLHKMTRNELFEMFTGAIILLGDIRMADEMFNGLSSTELEEYLIYLADHDLSYLYKK